MRVVLEVKAHELRVGDIVLDHRGARREVISLFPAQTHAHDFSCGRVITLRECGAYRKHSVTEADKRGNPEHWRISRESD